MFGMIYNAGMSISLILFGCLFLMLTGLLVLKFGWSFINDSKFKLPQWFNKLPFLRNEKPDGNKLVGFFIAALIFYMLATILWPLASITLIFFGVIFILRFVFRTRKCLGKLYKFAHGHPKTVKQTEFEAPDFNKDK